MSDFTTHLLANIGFTVGAIAVGLWMVLGLYWLLRTKGIFRVALIWIAINIIGTTATRVWGQVQNYENDDFPTIDSVRLVFNVSVLALGIFLAKYSGALQKEDQLNES